MAIVLNALDTNGRGTRVEDDWFLLEESLHCRQGVLHGFLRGKLSLRPQGPSAGARTGLAPCVLPYQANTLSASRQLWVLASRRAVQQWRPGSGQAISDSSRPPCEPETAWHLAKRLGRARQSPPTDFRKWPSNDHLARCVSGGTFHRGRHRRWSLPWFAR